MAQHFLDLLNAFGGSFNPQGRGFDDSLFEAMRLRRGPSGHAQSRVELPPSELKRLGFPEGSARVLKGRKHKSFDRAVEGEEREGFKIIEGEDGFLYSVPKDFEPGQRVTIPPSIRDLIELFRGAR